MHVPQYPQYSQHISALPFPLILDAIKIHTGYNRPLIAPRSSRSIRLREWTFAQAYAQLSLAPTSSVTGAYVV